MKVQSQQMVFTTNNGTETILELSEITELEFKQNNLITKTTEGRNTINLYSIDKITFELSTGIEDMAGKNAIRLFPNPVNDSFTLENAPDEVDEIAIYSIEGRQEGKYRLKNSGNTITTNHLSPGIYFIVAGEEIIKFIKL